MVDYRIYTNIFHKSCLSYEISDKIGLDLIALNISDEDGVNSSMTDVFGVAGTGIELIPPRQFMGRLSYNF